MEPKERLYVAAGRTALIVVSLLIAVAVVARLPMLDQFPGVRSVVHGVAALLVLAVLVLFTLELEGYLRLTSVAFPETGVLVRNTLAILIVIIGYYALKAPADTWAPNHTDLYNLLFLVLGILAVAATVGVAWRNIDFLSGALLQTLRRRGCSTGRRTCAKCEAPLAWGVRFCPSCGEEAAPRTAEAGTPTQRKCLDCGAAVSPEARFCRECGSELPTQDPAPDAAEPPDEPQAPPTCGSCGAELDQDAKFCPDCGAATATGDGDQPDKVQTQ